MGLYITPQYVIKIYDPRRVFEMISDTGLSEDSSSFAANDALLEAIRNAEAELDEVLQVGAHYSQSDLLAACAAADNPTGTPTEIEVIKRRVAPIREMLAHLVFGKLMMRRGYSADRMRELAPMYEAALERLERIASGQRVLDFTANIAAGVPQSVTLGRRGSHCGMQFSPLFGVPGGCCGYPGYSGTAYPNPFGY